MKIDRKEKSYLVHCPTCSKAKWVTYGQYWNVKVGKSKGRCFDCVPKNKIGLMLGRAWNKGLVGYKKGHPAYVRLVGEKNPAWKGGVTPINKKIRNSKEYANWRTAVFLRDNYTCLWCKKVGGKLCADHIKPFSLFPALRFAMDNGRTLCESCHKKTDTYLSKVLSYGI